MKLFICSLVCILFIGCASSSYQEATSKEARGPLLPGVVDEESLDAPGALLPVQVDIKSIERTVLLSGNWRVYDDENTILFNSQRLRDPKISISKKYKAIDEDADRGSQCSWDKSTCKIDFGNMTYKVFISGSPDEQTKREVEIFLEKLSGCNSSGICDLR